MRKIVINGANGYVASHFINELLIQNYEVIALVRNKSKYSSEYRMKDMLFQINNTANEKFRNLKVYNYNLMEEDFSLQQQQIEDIFGETVDYFHFAACLKYNAKDKNEIFETNVDGIENSIKTFLKHSKPASRFFYISTVYSCGRFSGLFEERFYENRDISSFRNYYEQSKRYAENIIRKYIEEGKLEGYVIRLSQVVGNNITGITRTDYGIFDFVKRLSYFTIKRPDSKVRIRIDPDSTQNLIAIDTVINYLMGILTITRLPLITNFVGKSNIRNDQIIKCICELLPIRIIEDKTLEMSGLSAIERIIAAGMSFTGGYANTNLLFDHKNLDKFICQDENEITEQSLYRMLEYFVKERTKNKSRELYLPHYIRQN